jgi:hypothetical protein
MMLHGTAKRDYMREYMRKRRAGEPTRKPKPEWEPTQRMVDEVEHWFYLKLHRRRDLRGIGRAVVAGLDPHNEDGTANEASWTEALQRYRTLRAERRAGRRVRRKREEAERNAPPPPKRCSFCNEPASAKSTLVGPSDYSFPLICETCTKEAAAIFAKVKAGKAVPSICTFLRDPMRRTRDALPKRATAHFEKSCELAKAAKGLGG